ncbi:MAG: hypothetical protein JRI61_00045 [Deltaproteobacteria bacterium]|nr:hypothetical protein [Deltaproteobacteria bacterium]
MSDKYTVVEEIKRNITTLYHIILLVVCTLIFLTVKFLFRFLDYIPQASTITILTSISALVIISLYLSRTIAKSAIKEKISLRNWYIMIN